MTSSDSETVLWDVATGLRVRTWKGSHCARVSPNDRSLVLNAGPTAMIYDLETGRLTAVCGDPKAKSQIRHVDFSPSGAFFAVSSDDGAARVWRTRDGKAVASFSLGKIDGFGETYEISEARFSPDERFLTTCGFELCRWEIATGKPVWRVSAAGAAQLSLGGRWASVLSVGSLSILDMSTGKSVVKVSPGRSSSHVVWFEDDQRLALGMNDGKTRIYSVSGKLLREVGDAGGRVNAIAVSDDGTRLAMEPDSVAGSLWSLATGERLRTAIPGGKPTLFSPDGKRVLLEEGFPALQLISTEKSPPWKPPSNAPSDFRLLPPLSRQEYDDRTFGWGIDRVNCVAGDARQGRLAVGLFRNVLLLESSGKIKSFLAHPGGIESIEFSPDGKKVLTAGFEGTATVTDLDSEQVIRTLKAGNTVWHARYASDGKRILTASDDGEVVAWDAATGERKQEFKGLEKAFDARWLTNGRIFATSGDGASCVWEEDGHLVASLKSHPSLGSYAIGRTSLALTDLFTDTVTLYDLKSLLPLQRSNYR